MFEFLDKPREAVWNLGRGVSDMLEGNAPSAADIIPGLAGIAGTAGLAATGVGLPLALLAGSALGGGAQAAVGNKAMTPGEFLQEHAGMEQGSPESTVSSMLLGMATDPLTFAGAGIGRGAGKALGGNLDRTAEVLGPRYGTTTEDLTKMITPYVADMKAKLVANGGVPSRSWAEELLHPFREAINSPNASRLLSEVHPESTVLGSGLEGFALRSPAGNVTRIGEPDHFIEGVARGRPVSDMMLQPTRSVSLRDELSGHRVEHVPFAEGVGTVDSPARDELARALSKEGIEFTDAHAGNVGLHGGAPKVIDPGAVSVQPEFTGQFSPVVDATQQPGRMSELLHKLLGGDPRMRKAVEAGLANPGYTGQYGNYGTLAGALAGGVH